MTNVNISSFFDDLDLTNPDDLVWGFLVAQYWPENPPIDEDSSARMLAAADEFAPLIFGVPDNQSTIENVQLFVMLLGGYDLKGEVTTPRAPREWLHVFREAHARGVIGPVAFGAAFRFFMVRAGGNGAPALPADSLAARRQALHDIRSACPTGLMTDAERATLAALPEVVPLYRGGRSDCGLAPIDQAKALHWALDREYAAGYMRGRGHQRTVQTINRMLSNVTAFAAGLPAFAPRAPRAGQSELQGTPFLIEARVPKPLVLAYFATGVGGALIELLVDFDKLTPDMLRDVTPAGYRWAA